MADRQADPTEFERARRLIERRLQRYLRRSPYRFFPDQVVVRSLVRRLAHNLVRHGHQYCPCRPISGDREADRRNICPCRTHAEEIARDGHCECRLFVSQEFARQRLNRKEAADGQRPQRR